MTAIFQDARKGSPRFDFCIPLLALPAICLAQPAAAQEEGLGDIVVTAQRKEQNLQDVPVAVTAFTEQAIEANRIQNVGDIAALAPNTLVRAQPGGNASPQFTIRGVTAGNTAAGTSNGVGLYIDGVYIGRSVGALFDVADLERIEILKGPQGTLFGRNSTGGAVSLTTRDPRGTFAVRQDLSAGNFGLVRSRTRIDLPEWNGLSAAITYLHTERDGDIRNLGAGTVWDFGPVSGGRAGKYRAAKTLGATNSDGILAALRFRSGDFDAVYKFDFTDSYQSAPGVGILAITAPVAQTILSSQPGGVTTNRIRPDAVNNWFTSANHVKAQGHVLTTSYAVSANLSIKNILAWRKSSGDGINQIDGAGGLYVQPAFSALCGGAACVGRPFLMLGNAQQNDYRQFSEEFQVSYSGSALDAIAGAYYFNDKTVAGGIAVGQSRLLQAVQDFVITGPLVDPYVYKSRSTALFAQVTAHLSDQVDAVGGYRHTWDRKRADEPTMTTVFRNDSNTPSWLAGLNYKPNDTTLVYGKVSTGYITGGVLNGVTYDPEKVTTYEAGVKNELFDRKLRLNTALFYSRFRSIQFATFFNGLSVQDNAGNARSWGGELEAVLKPSRALTLSVNAGYTNFKYTQLDPGIGNVDTFRPNHRPKWSGSAYVDYSFEPFSWGGQLSARVDAQYHSRYALIPSPATAEIAQLTKSPETVLLNGRLALSDIAMGTGNLQIALWGKNLTDNKSLSYSPPVGLVVAALYEAARSYGVDVTIRF